MEEPLEVKLIESYIKADEVRSKFKTVVEFLGHYADTIPDNEAIVFVSTDDSRQAITWSQLYERSQQYARAFFALGLKRDEVVVLSLRQCPEWLYVTFGAMIIGAKSANVVFNFKDGSDVIAMTEKLGNCAILIIDAGIECANWTIAKKLVDHVDNLSGKVKSAKIPYLRYFFGFEPDGEANMPELMHLRELESTTIRDVVFNEVNESDIAFIFNTSGSTGNPKLVAHSHRSIVAVNNPQESPVPYHMITMYNDRPFAWIGGCVLNVVSGMKRITMSGFCKPPLDYMTFVSQIVIREKCAILCLLPSSIPEFVRRYEILNFNASPLFVTTGGQPVRKNLMEQICMPPTCTPMLAYGATEFGVAATTLVSDPTKYEDFKCGQPFKGVGIEIKVVDDNGGIVPVNTRGNIFVRSPGLMKGYLNDPDATAKMITSDLWYKTDDIGRLSENGVLYVEGRKSNVIISDGINVIPEILEGILESCPGVDASVIVPIPDELYYQVLCACVVCTPGSDIDEQKIRTFCEEYHNEKVGIMAAKLPKFYMILDSFPEVFTGKVDRLKLTKIATERFVDN